VNIAYKICAVPSILAFKVEAEDQMSKFNHSTITLYSNRFTT